MSGSIAHPDSVARRAAVDGLRVALDRELRAAAATTDASVAASLRVFVDLLGSIDPASPATAPSARSKRPAVCRFWEASLRAAPERVPRALVEALETLGSAFAWTQNPNYRRQPPDATFLDNYAYAVIAGPVDGPPALAVDPRLALGVLLLGPRTHYPLHAHPAVEIYYPLTGGEWWLDNGPWRSEPPGAVIHHAPNVRHATRAGASPLLAIYLWRGDLATHAKLTETRV